jgi:hypothetical protein
MPPPPSPTRWYRSTRFWSGAGAVLGLSATLWATLVGETIPQIISSSRSPIESFRHSVGSACRKLPPSVTSIAELSQTKLPSDGRPRLYSGTTASVIAAGANAKLYTAVDEVARALLTIQPPAALVPEFRRFQGGWTNTGAELRQAVSSAYELTPPVAVARNAAKALVASDNRAFSLITSEIETASLLGLPACVEGLASLTYELQTLSELAVAQRTPVEQDPGGLWKLVPLESCPQGTAFPCISSDHISPTIRRHTSHAR